jgi:hypothetical protein
MAIKAFFIGASIQQYPPLKYYKNCFSERLSSKYPDQSYAKNPIKSPKKAFSVQIF